MDRLFIYNCHGAVQAVIYGLLNTRKLVEPVNVERLDNLVTSGYLVDHHLDFHISREEARKICDYIHDSKSFCRYSHVSELHREFPILANEGSGYPAYGGRDPLLCSSDEEFRDEQLLPYR